MRINRFGWVLVVSLLSAAARAEGTPPVEIVEQNENARKWLTDNSKKDHDAGGNRFSGRVFTIYHLPDGSPAFPIPAHITEHDRIQLLLLKPNRARMTVKVLTCDKVPEVRVLGTLADVTAPKAAVGGPPVAHQPDSTEITDIKHNRELQCSGTLRYEITIEIDGKNWTTSTAIELDPVYRLSWGAAMVFDFGRPVSLSLKDRAASGGGTEKFIAQSRDMTGMRAMVTLGLHLCGANPRDWTWCDRFIPFVGIDPVHLTDGFSFGLNFSPVAGIGVLVGMSVSRTDVLEESTGLKPGDVFSATGELPKRSIFDEAGIGWFIGVAVTSEVLSKLSVN